MTAYSGDSRGRVSVVIPAYNAGSTLGAAINSLLVQSAPPLEIIVVDDGSTDDTREVLRRFGTQVTVLSQANSGLAAARHTGVAAARGEMIALFDADDLCDPRRLALQTEYLDAHPDILLCSTDFAAFDERGVIAASFASSYYGAFKRYSGGLPEIFSTREVLFPSVPLSEENAALRIDTYRGRIYEKLVLGNFVHPPTIMFRRSALQAVGNFDRSAGSMCDWDWILRAARVGEIGYIAYPLLQYRISATQMSGARYHYRRAVDNMLILERFRRRDPETYSRMKKELNDKFGSYCLDAADAICEEQRLTSLKWLCLSVLKRPRIAREHGLILAKMLLPARARNLARQLKNRAETLA